MDDTAHAVAQIAQTSKTDSQAGTSDRECEIWRNCPGHAELPGAAVKRVPTSIMSPLRYPGSKRRLGGYIAQALRMNGLQPALFVEPFAGGASVSLQLANQRAVERIGLIELDPLVAAFWQTVFFDADWLVNRVENIEVTLSQWDAFKADTSTGRRERAIKCLFLNRTSFSGILAPRSGPIGGRKQCSDHKLGCRFPRATLIRRIRQAEKLKDRVAFVWNLHWRTGLGRLRQMQRAGTMPHDLFVYLDPPFFAKAERLYTFYFHEAAHRSLREYILQLTDNWILSYDPAADVTRLYGEASRDAVHVELLYSTSGTTGRGAAREIVLSNLPALPAEGRLWGCSARAERPTGDQCGEKLPPAPHFVPSRPESCSRERHKN